MYTNDSGEGEGVAHHDSMRRITKTVIFTLQMPGLHGL